jgi:predicted TIM-barrel fold metal-dependent hydrolase
MIVDCHGHYTTAPQALWDWRKQQVSDPKNFSRKLNISDQELRDSLEGAQLKLQRERGSDLTFFSPRAGSMEHHVGDAAVSQAWSRECNDLIHRVCSLYPANFAPVCQLPQSPGVPPANCIPELERCVKELGFKGWKTHSNFGDSYIDERRYWPILAKAEELGVVIYLHPVAPMIKELRTYGLALAGAAFGFGVETATAMMRLILSGAFDAFPKLKIMIGHYGEGLPFLMQRIDHPFVRPHLRSADPEVVPELKRVPSDYLRDNMLMTTSGNYLPAAFKCTREALGMERILLGTDYPYEEMSECMNFLEGLGLSQEEKELLFYRNARDLGIS